MSEDTVKILCEVDPTVKLCCLNTDCLNHVEGLNVCNLKNLIMAPGHTCAGFVKMVPKKKPAAVKRKKTTKKK
jgi:hypothetical protein